MPGGDVQSGDAGGAPARGEIIEVDASAIGGIEEGPEARGAEGGAQAEVGERLQHVGKTLIAAIAGTGGDPEHGAASR